MNVRALAPINGRSMIHPSLVRPGPFRRWLPADADTDLAQGRVRDGPSERVRTRPGRIWIPINLPIHQNPHRLK